jgi:hypothetical protein
MRLNNFDKIVSMHRNKSDAMIYLGKLWKRSIAYSLYEPTEFDLMNPKYYDDIHYNKWEYSLNTNLEFAQNKFKVVLDKQVKTEEDNSIVNS